LKPTTKIKWDWEVVLTGHVDSINQLSGNGVYLDLGDYFPPLSGTPGIVAVYATRNEELV
jgi:hypothetical protein